MTSPPVRNPIADHLLTPDNSALLFIDYQPLQLAGVRSMDRALRVKNVAVRGHTKAAARKELSCPMRW
jgi:hypothetical protein